mgnify:FL=1
MLPAQPIVAARTFRNKRPVDKALIVVNKTGVGGTRVNTDLVTATFPCTITGLRWSMGVQPDGSTGTGRILWAVVVLRDGGTLGTMSVSDAGTVYTPEQDVMVFGASSLLPNTSTINQAVQFEGSTKTMRKLMGGDKLVFIAIGENINTAELFGVFQFFCKS